MDNLNITKLQTEQRNSNTLVVDTLSTLDIVKLINQEDMQVPLAIKEKLDVIATACDEIVETIKNGGRLVYIGAGTSGRMGVMDAAECMPTFGVKNEVLAILAGGKKAMFAAVEGAEDSEINAIKALEELSFNRNDILVGIAASGRTPYVLSALQYAKTLGAKTVCLSCNEDSEIGKVADISIEIYAGPEVLTGSTRMKAGTVQKSVCNMLTTTSMIKLGKVYSNLMVDMIATNKKLEIRTISIIKEATGCGDEEANRALKLADKNCKLAILYILSNKDIRIVKKALHQSNGYIRKALEILKE